MANTNGVVIGLVKSLEDPENLGRIQVTFPWLSGDNESRWARVATLMAGGDRGSWFMPEVDDEVLVAFEQGHMQNPYIVGFLWNGEDKPPNSDINPKVRRLQTVSGHVVEFDDNSGQERILIKSQGGQEVEIKDRPAGQITIKTKAGQQITMSDPSDLPPKIEISTTVGQVKVSCVQASIEAKALLQVTAPIAQFNGVIQAASVVSGSYTPAPGNTLGL